MLVVPGPVLAEAVRKQEHRHRAAHAALRAQLRGAQGGIAGDAAVQLPEVLRVTVERAGRGDALPVGRMLLEADAGLAVQLAPRAQAGHPHAPPHPLPRQLCEVPCRAHPLLRQHPPPPGPHAPHVVHGKTPEDLADVLRAMHEAGAVELRIAFAEFRGDLGQGFGRGDADADRNARMAPHRAGDAVSQGVEVRIVHAREVKKRLVDRIDLRGGHQTAQHPHHPPRHVAVEREIGREHRHVGTPYRLAQLKKGLSHRDAEAFGLVRAGDDAAVVVRKHHDGAPFERRVEHPFARSVEIVAVAKSVEWHRP